MQFQVMEGIDMINKEKRIPDKRNFRRLDFLADASSKGDFWSFSGKVLNISNMGAYLATNGPYAVNDQIDLTLSFQNGETKLAVSVPCKVARVDGHGVGLISLHIDANNLMNLKLLFEMYKNDPKQLFEEFCKSI
jgi:hypothetical protein